MGIGRVAFLTEGAHSQKLAVIVDIIDGTRALIDGPCSGVPRQEYKFSHLHLTKYSVKSNMDSTQSLCARHGKLLKLIQNGITLPGPRIWRNVHSVHPSLTTIVSS